MGGGVDARAIAGGLSFVTTAASDGFGREIVVGMFIGKIAVALGAGRLAVNGLLEERLIHVHRNDDAVIGRGQCLVTVALQTVTILDLRGGQH